MERQMKHGSKSRDSIADSRDPYIDYYAATNRLREGTLSSGEQYKPFPWLENNTIPKSKQQVTIEKAMESCTFKSLLSCVMGYGLGAAFGLITSGLDPTIAGDVGQPSKLNTRETLREMGKRSGSYAKNFAMFGAMYSGTECVIESYRGKSDLVNSGLAGCTTGGVIGLRAGVTAGMAGCGAFAAFSLAIDYFLRR